MQPIGPLMHEHRNIERIISLLRKEDGALASGKTPDVPRIEELIVLMREFADACHHGKEEDILFRDLKKKELSEEHLAMINSLEEDHVRARKILKSLENATREYKDGKKQVIMEMQSAIEQICGLYPGHIEREDKQFFFPCMEYFSDEERDAMLKEFEEFERDMPHEQYLERIEALENTGSPLAR